MQNAMHEETQANQMDESPTYSLPALPEEETGGAEVRGTWHRVPDASHAADPAWHPEALPQAGGNSVVGYPADGFLIQGSVNSSLSLEGYEDFDVGLCTGINVGHDLVENNVLTNTFLEDAAYPSFPPVSSGSEIDNEAYPQFAAPGPGTVFSGHSNQMYPSMHAPIPDPQPIIIANAYAPSFYQSIQRTAAVVAQTAQIQPPIPCHQPGCAITFKRETDRIRHQDAVHGINQLLSMFLCPVFGCPKSQGSGYTRKDKLTEHLWRKHGDLGYTKRIQ